MKKGNPKRDLFRGSASNAMMAFALAARSKTVALVVLVVHRPSSIHLVCKANSLSKSEGPSLSPSLSPARSLHPPSLSLHFPSALSFPLPSLSLPMFPNALSPLPLPSLPSFPTGDISGLSVASSSRALRSQDRGGGIASSSSDDGFPLFPLARSRSLSSSRHSSVTQQARPGSGMPASRMHGE